METIEHRMDGVALLPVVPIESDVSDVFNQIGANIDVSTANQLALSIFGDPCELRLETSVDLGTTWASYASRGFTGAEWDLQPLVIRVGYDTAATGIVFHHGITAQLLRIRARSLDPTGHLKLQVQLGRN